MDAVHAQAAGIPLLNCGKEDLSPRQARQAPFRGYQVIGVEKALRFRSPASVQIIAEHGQTPIPVRVIPVSEDRERFVQEGFKKRGIFLRGLRREARRGFWICLCPEGQMLGSM